MVINLVILITFTLDDLRMLLGENWCWSLLRPKGLKAVHTWSVRTWPTFTNWRFNFIHHHTLVISSRVMIFLLSSSNLYISAANLVTGLKVTKVKEGKRELNYWKQNSSPFSNIHAVGQNEIQFQMVSLQLYSHLLSFLNWEMKVLPLPCRWLDIGVARMTT